MQCLVPTAAHLVWGMLSCATAYTFEALKRAPAHLQGNTLQTRITGVLDPEHCYTSIETEFQTICVTCKS